MLAVLAVSALLADPVPDAARVTDAEAARYLRADAAAYGLADRNGDGRIDDEELEAVKARLASASAGSSVLMPRAASVDRDGNGALTPDELYAEAR